ncbi:MAG TPA: response regulator transcription factor [Nevskiaceae bacterium]|nr:response regulator transcription factor [Nevskiaceae bacterium]
MRVILADTQVLVRAGLRKLIEALRGVEVVGETGDGQELLEMIGHLRPEVVVTEVDLVHIRGIDALQQAQRHYPEVNFLMLSSQHEARHVRSALKVGARGFLVKDAELPELELALRAVARGQTYLSPSISHNALNARRHQRAEEQVALTPRQRQVLQLVGRGRTTKEIAGLMGVSPKTVETHRMRMMQSLGLYGTSALMRFAIRVGADGGEF